MINLTSRLDTLTTFPLRSPHQRYLNGLIHGGAVIALLALAAAAILWL